jgi:hypothetical protein
MHSSRRCPWKLLYVGSMWACELDLSPQSDTPKSIQVNADWPVLGVTSPGAHSIERLVEDLQPAGDATVNIFNHAWDDLRT